MVPIRKWAEEKKEVVPAQSQNAANVLAEYVDNMGNQQSRPWVIPTRITKLDNAFNGGLTQGRSTIVAGVPGSGKTTFCTQVALSAASMGARVGYMSLELDEERLLHRLLAIVTGIPADRIAKRQFKDQHEISHIKDKARLVRTDMQNIQLHTIPQVNDENDVWQLDIATMRQTLDKLRDEHHLQLLILDYLQLAFDEDIKKAVPFSRFLLTSVPRSYNIHVLAAGQVSAKKVSMRQDKMPEAGDVAWAGEAQADNVLFTHRRYLYTGMPVDMEQALLIITKNRDNPFLGSILTRFNGMRFSDVEAKNESA